MRANHFLVFGIFCALVTTNLVHGQGQSGYISIDCGIPPYDTPEDTMTNINYVSDEAFITTGVNFNVSADYGALNNPVLPSTLAEVRAFPRGNRNCYTIKISQWNLYLIRAWFMYGNYDGLELRPVNSSIYGTEFGRNASLVLYQRWDIGYLNGTGRYQDDRFDRIWSTYSSNISWNSIITSAYIDVFQNGYWPPDEVIKTAASPTNDDDPLELFWTSYDPNARFYAYLYFAELETLENNETRKIKILWNGSPVSKTSFEPSSKYSVTFSNPRAFTGKDHWISIQKTADSTLPPILNAIEIFTAQSLDEFYTITDDVKAIESIKATYKVNKVWSGDPCSPRLFPWEGIGCSYNNNNHQIKSLNLSSSGLQGPIVLAFRNLSLLESLDLSNNDLQQNIPEFLADLKHLKLLNLKGNNFTGFIPKSLMKKIKAGLLALSVDDQNLCNSRSCQDKKKKNMVVPIAIGTSVIILIVVLVVILIILRQRKKRAYSGPLLPSGKRRFTYNEVSSITNNFKKVIGKGGFGIVYLGSLEDGTKIAVKMINDPSLGKPKGSSTSSSSRASSQFQVEAELLLTVHHRNLASFVGYCDDDRSMALIYEYMANGNLQAYLSSENAEDLSWEKRLHIAIDSAQGLEYLHDGCRPAIVHRDVKTANILLNDNLEAKIADFGLSKVFPEDDLSHVVTTVMGTPGYVDPEYYRTFVLNEKSDVYSFGVVLLELITGQRAIIKTEEGDNISVIHYVWPFFEARELDGVVDPLLRGDFSEDSAWKFVDVAMSCVRDKGSNRPTMNQIVMELKQCLAAELARETQSQ
ncbi:Malectin-like domain [Arabidopsis thaliana x Arabidopsis arenosa]|uniref:non-specific serine/threonine protein kinase n=1 Tax=Arabidopsis thaliana x Arabidopsis arenosa TaxID=1240361 RepID=A0A8T1Y155_9BRAS|nr:Malectin-like domain [Arabidopsis thaliana x Arabidopsis arenosa]